MHGLLTHFSPHLSHTLSFSQRSCHRCIEPGCGRFRGEASHFLHLQFSNDRRSEPNNSSAEKALSRDTGAHLTGSRLLRLVGHQSKTHLQGTYNSLFPNVSRVKLCIPASSRTGCQKKNPMLPLLKPYILVIGDWFGRANNLRSELHMFFTRLIIPNSWNYRLLTDLLKWIYSAYFQLHIFILRLCSSSFVWLIGQHNPFSSPAWPCCSPSVHVVSDPELDKQQKMDGFYDNNNLQREIQREKLYLLEYFINQDRHEG